MEKKMYNVPSTAVTEIESVHVIMEGTTPLTDKPEQGGTGGGGDAPSRYPQF
ncbi:MAG: hypothetical protein J6T32_04325 [Paludibacteraceae bacterium]|nr:hypothetical protein [Paludibacteraceae bacterium]